MERYEVLYVERCLVVGFCLVSIAASAFQRMSYSKPLRDKITLATRGLLIPQGP